MATAAKVGWAQLKVGLLGTAAFIILGVLIFLMTGSKNFLAKYESVYLYMDDAQSMAIGAPVRLNGIVVGEVAGVDLSGEADPRRIVKLRLKIKEAILRSIPVDSISAVSAENLLGSKFVNIKKGQSKEMIRPGGEVKALDTRSFDEVVQQGYAVLASLQGIATKAEKIVAQIENGQGSIGKLLTDDALYNNLNKTVLEVEYITKALTTNQGTIGKLIYDPDLYRDIRGTISKLNGLLADVQTGKGTTGRLIQDPALYEDLQQTTAELRQIVQDLNAGKGTAGSLLKSDELKNELKATLAKVNTTIDKVNSGEGTIGQLLVNPQLYDNLNGASAEFKEFAKEFRKNPKKYLRIKLSIF